MAERTEAATPRRREEARKRGQIPKSNELSVAFLLVGFLLVVRYAGGFMTERTLDIFRRGFHQAATTELDNRGLGDLVQRAFSDLGVLVLPVVAMSIAVSLVVGIAQTRFLFTSYPLSPKLNRINPLNGFKRLFSRRALFEFVKSMLKLVIIGYTAWSTMLGLQPLMMDLAGMEFSAFLVAMAGAIWQLLLNIGTVYLILAIVDYWFQRREHERDLRMSKQEIKEEIKLSEGDPMIRARIRARQRQVAFSRMMQEVPKADVVITNPIHLAIALKYDEEEMQAPMVLAKGQRLVAEKIKGIAREHGIPVVEDRPLAQSLYASVEIGQEVPFDLYRAVAEVLAMIYRLKQRSA